MKIPKFAELLSDYDAVLLGVWKIFHYSPKRDSILESVQQIYGKKPLKMLRAAVTRWLEMKWKWKWFEKNFRSFSGTS